MNCRDCQPLLIDSLLGDLSPNQAEDVAHHVAGCDPCAAEFQQLQRDFSQLAELSAPFEPLAGLKARLLSTLPAQESAQESTPPVVAFKMSEALDVPVAYERHGYESAAERSDGWLSADWSRPAALAATLAGVLLGVWGVQTLRATRAESAADRARAQAQSQAAQELAATMQASSRLTNQGALRNASFASADTPSLTAMLTLDVLSRQVHFHAVGLPETPADKTYRLWLIDDADQWVAAGDIVSDSTRMPSSEDDASVYQLLAKSPQHERPFVAAALALGPLEIPASGEPGKVIAKNSLENRSP